MEETETIEQMREELFQLENRMRTLEWDYNREQINPYKKQVFENMLKEKEQLVNKINSLENIGDE
jgi:cell division protein ZapA (FtsZ GTPase activity inhibitor)